MEIAELVFNALVFIFPAYCANAFPVLAGGGTPIDFGRKLWDGKPFFGKNKTFRGFFSGLVIGTVVGLAESTYFGFHPLFGLMLSLGALCGDLTGAFVKRRLGLAPGQLLPFVDQVDFIIGAVLFSFTVNPPLMSLGLLFTVLIITPPIHLLTNLLAYRLKLKSNPW